MPPMDFTVDHQIYADNDKAGESSPWIELPTGEATNEK